MDLQDTGVHDTWRWQKIKLQLAQLYVLIDCVLPILSMVFFDFFTFPCPGALGSFFHGFKHGIGPRRGWFGFIFGVAWTVQTWVVARNAWTIIVIIIDLVTQKKSIRTKFQMCARRQTAVGRFLHRPDILYCLPTPLPTNSPASPPSPRCTDSTRFDFSGRTSLCGRSSGFIGLRAAASTAFELRQGSPIEYPCTWYWSLIATQYSKV